MKAETTPLVSVVILTWNRREDLRETLEKVLSGDYPALEIIVVDNNSSDGTGDMVREKFPQAVYLPQKENLGIAGYNIGLKVAGGEYVVVLDSDSWPAKNAISRMVGLFGKCPEAGAVAFDIRYPARGLEEKDADEGEIEEVVGYHGAGAGFRREVFEKAGYWYEPYFLYFNEMDHALNMLKAGYKIVRSPSVRAFHKSSKTARPSASAPYYYSRNALWLFFRHYPLADMFRATAYFIYLAVSESFSQGTLVYLSAVRDALKGAPEVLRTRNPLTAEMFKKVRIPLRLVFSRWA